MPFDNYQKYLCTDSDLGMLNKGDALCKRH